MPKAVTAVDLKAKVMDYIHELRSGYGFQQQDEVVVTNYVMAFMKKCGYADANHDRIFDEGLRHEALSMIHRGRWSIKNPNPSRATRATKKDVQKLNKAGIDINVGDIVIKDPRWCPLAQLDHMIHLAAGRLTGDFREVAKLQAYRVIRTGGQLPLPVEIPDDLMKEMIELAEAEFRKIV